MRKGGRGPFLFRGHRHAIALLRAIRGPRTNNDKYSIALRIGYFVVLEGSAMMARYPIWRSTAAVPADEIDAGAYTAAPIATA